MDRDGYLKWQWDIRQELLVYECSMWGYKRLHVLFSGGVFLKFVVLESSLEKYSTGLCCCDIYMRTIQKLVRGVQFMFGPRQVSKYIESR